MPLVPKETIVVSKVLDKLWVKSLHIDADIQTQMAEAVVLLVPYNDEGQFSEEAAIRVVITEILEKVQANPDGNLAKAYGALLAAIQEEYLEQA